MGADKLGGYFRINGGPTSTVTIYLDMVPAGEAVMFATPYPSTTTFTSLTVHYPWSTSSGVELQSHSSRNACADDTSGLPVYYWDASNAILYMKIVDPLRTGADMEEILDDAYT